MVKLYKQYKLLLNVRNIPELRKEGTRSRYHANKTENKAQVYVK